MATATASYFAQNGANVDFRYAGNIVLYAHWTIKTVTVTYYANKPTGTHGASHDVTVVGTPTRQVRFTDSFNLPSATSMFTLTGWTLQSWNTQADGLGTSYALGASQQYLIANLDLYAIWQANTYVVHFNSNGASVYHDGDVTGTTADQTFTYDTPANLRANGYSLTGYTFAGWALTASGAVEYADEAEVLNLTTEETRTIYAKWTTNTYYVDYYAFNAGSGATPLATDTFKYDVQAKLKKASTITGAILDGFTFTGWGTAANASRTGGTKVYDDEHSVKNLVTANNGHKALYAIYRANTYNITYTLNGGTISGSNPSSYTVSESNQTIAINNPTKHGYTFTGWTSNNSRLSISGTTLTITALGFGDTNFTANFTADTFTVEFSKNAPAGYSVDGTTASVTATYGAGITLTANGYTLTGWQWAGWNTAANGSGTKYADEASIPTATVNSWYDETGVGKNGTKTLYAQWAEKYYAVKINANGGRLEVKYSTLTATVSGNTQLTVYARFGSKVLYYAPTAPAYVGDGSEIYPISRINNAYTGHTLLSLEHAGYYSATFDADLVNNQILNASFTHTTTAITLSATWATNYYAITFRAVAPGDYAALGNPTLTAHYGASGELTSTGTQQITIYALYGSTNLYYAATNPVHTASGTAVQELTEFTYSRTAYDETGIFASTGNSVIYEDSATLSTAFALSTNNAVIFTAGWEAIEYQIVYGNTNSNCDFDNNMYGPDGDPNSNYTSFWYTIETDLTLAYAYKYWSVANTNQWKAYTVQIGEDENEDPIYADIGSWTEGNLYAIDLHVGIGNWGDVNFGLQFVYDYFDVVFVSGDDEKPISPEITSVSVQFGSLIADFIEDGNLPASATTSTMGYSFTDWYNKPTGGTRIVDLTGSKFNAGYYSWEPEDHTTGVFYVYARWTTKPVILTIHSNVQGSTYDGATFTYEYTQVVRRFADDYKIGYAFDDFYWDNHQGTVVSWPIELTEDELGSYITEDANACYVTIYTWLDIIDYTLTLDANGGTVNPDEFYPVHYGDTVNLPTPTRPGYDFTGWTNDDEPSASKAWDGSHSASLSGAGTQANPYLVQNAKDLAYIAYTLNSSDASAQAVNNFSGKYFLQTEDIYLNGLEWEPIGTTDNRSFWGHYDGDGHAIWDMYIDISGSTATYAGLFGRVGSYRCSEAGVSPSVENVYLMNPEVHLTKTSGNKTFAFGYFAGYAYGGAYFDNCNVFGGYVTLTGVQNSGSIIGQTAKYNKVTPNLLPTIDTCYVSTDSNVSLNYAKTMANTTVIDSGYKVVVINDQTYTSGTQKVEPDFDYDDGSARVYTTSIEYLYDYDVTLTANWRAHTYTLTFDANKPGKMSATPTQTAGSIQVTYLANTNLTSAYTATATGWTFQGYFTAATGGTKLFTNTGAVVSGVAGFTDSNGKWIGTENKTVYAQWTANTYTIYFNANKPAHAFASTNVVQTAASITVTYDDNTNLTSATKYIATLTGFTFTGYYNATSGGTKAFNADGTINTASGSYWGTNGAGTAGCWKDTTNKTFYAQWTENTYNVTFANVYNSFAVKVLDYTGALLNTYTISSSNLTISGIKYTDIITTSTNNVAKRVDGTAFTAVSAGNNPTRTGYDWHKPGADFVFSIVTNSNLGYRYNGNWNANTGNSNLSPYDTGCWAFAALSPNYNVVMTLYWTPHTYTIAYNGNKPAQAFTNVTGSTASTTATYDSGATLATNGYSLTGFTFAGWSTTAGGSVEYASGASVTASTINSWYTSKGATKTLYAVWTENTYNIAFASVYNAFTVKVARYNGADAVEHTVDSTHLTISNIRYTDIVVLGGVTISKQLDNTTDLTTTLSTTTAPSRTGYTWGILKSTDFRGYVTIANRSDVFARYGRNSASEPYSWYTSSSGSDASFMWHSRGFAQMNDTNGATVTMTLQWTPNNYTLTFDANAPYSGASVSQTQSSITVTYDSTTNLTSNYVASTTGYTFLGYYDAATGGNQIFTNTGALVKGAGSLTTSAGAWHNAGNATVYARWSGNFYALEINFKGAGFDGSTKPTMTVSGTYGGTSAVSGNVTSPNGQVTYPNGTALTIVTDGNRTAADKQHGYIVDGGQTPVNYVSYNGTTGAADGTNKIYVRKTYSFSGKVTITISIPGYYIKVGSVPTMSDSYGSLTYEWTAQAGNTINIYAYKRYTITYAANSAVASSGAVNTTYKIYGTAATVANNTMTATGYSPAGWVTTNGSIKDTPDYANGASYSANANLALYANWGNRTYNMTFNANKPGSTTPTQYIGSDAGSTTASIVKTGWVTYNAAVGKTAYATATGYTFLGYYTDQTNGSQIFDGSGNIVSNVSGYTGTSGTWTRADHTTLFAHWRANSYTVTANANGGTIPATTGWTGTGDTATKSVTFDGTYGNLPVPTREGYTFSGWAGPNLFNPATMKFSNSSVSGDVISFNNQVYDRILNLSNWTPKADTFYTLVLDITENTFNQTTTIYTDSRFAIEYYNNNESRYYINSGKTGTIILTFKTRATNPDGCLGTIWLQTGNTVTGNFKARVAIFEGTTSTGYVPYIINSSTTVYTAADHDLTALWTANTYSVVFNKNAGRVGHQDSEVSGTMANQSFTYDAAATALSANAYTLAGYTFSGWATSTNGAKVYNDGASVRNLTSVANGTFNLYAVWTPNVYTIVFNANKPSRMSENPSLNPATMNVTYDAAIGSSSKASVNGWTFNGYFTATSGGTKIFNADGTLNKPSANNTWLKTTGAWKYALETVVGSDANVSYNSSTGKYEIKLYAQWTEHTYNVSFNTNYATSGSMTNFTASYESAYHISDYIATSLARTGYSFSGWRVTSGLNTSTARYGASADAVTNVMSSTTTLANSNYFKKLAEANGTNVTITAVWTANSYNITFYRNKPASMSQNQIKLSLGGVDDTTYANTYVTKNNFVTYDALVSSTAKASATGWTFLGFYTSATGGTQIFDASGNIKANVSGYTGNSKAGAATSVTNGKAWLYAGNVNLYAQWRANTYTIVFNKANPTDIIPGTSITGTMANLSMTYDTAANLTANAYALDGHKFMGWATSAGGTKVYNDKHSVNNLTATDGATVNLYTVWAAGDYEITYVLKGGSHGNTHPATYTFSANAQTLTLNYPTRTGFSFAGWTSSYNKISVSNQTINIQANAFGPVTLTANWEPERYTIGWDDGEGTGSTEPTLGVYPTSYGFKNENTTSEYLLKDSNGNEVTNDISAPTRVGYTFAGWTSSKNSIRITNNKLIIDANTTGNVVITATWTANKYSVTFYANKPGSTTPTQTISNAASTDATITKTNWVTFDAAVSDKAFASTNGYTFLGYFTDAAAGTKLFDENGNIVANVSGYTGSNGAVTNGKAWIKNGNASVYAHYAANKYAISLVNFNNANTDAQLNVLYSNSSNSIGLSDSNRIVYAEFDSTQLYVRVNGVDYPISSILFPTSRVQGKDSNGYKYLHADYTVSGRTYTMNFGPALNTNWIEYSVSTPVPFVVYANPKYFAVSNFETSGVTGITSKIIMTYGTDSVLNINNTAASGASNGLYALYDSNRIFYSTASPVYEGDGKAVNTITSIQGNTWGYHLGNTDVNPNIPGAEILRTSATYSQVALSTAIIADIYNLASATVIKLNWYANSYKVVNIYGIRGLSINDFDIDVKSPNSEQITAGTVVATGTNGNVSSISDNYGTFVSPNTENAAYIFTANGSTVGTNGFVSTGNTLAISVDTANGMNAKYEAKGLAIVYMQGSTMKIVKAQVANNGTMSFPAIPAANKSNISIVPLCLLKTVNLNVTQVNNHMGERAFGSNNGDGPAKVGTYTVASTTYLDEYKRNQGVAGETITGITTRPIFTDKYSNGTELPATIYYDEYLNVSVTAKTTNGYYLYDLADNGRHSMSGYANGSSSETAFNTHNNHLASFAYRTENVRQTKTIRIDFSQAEIRFAVVDADSNAAFNVTTAYWLDTAITLSQVWSEPNINNRSSWGEKMLAQLYGTRTVAEGSAVTYDWLGAKANYTTATSRPLVNNSDGTRSLGALSMPTRRGDRTDGTLKGIYLDAGATADAGYITFNLTAYYYHKMTINVDYKVVRDVPNASNFTQVQEEILHTATAIDNAHYQAEIFKITPSDSELKDYSNHASASLTVSSSASGTYNTKAGYVTAVSGDTTTYTYGVDTANLRYAKSTVVCTPVWSSVKLSNLIETYYNSIGLDNGLAEVHIYLPIYTGSGSSRTLSYVMDITNRNVAVSDQNSNFADILTNGTAIQNSYTQQTASMVKMGDRGKNISVNSYGHSGDFITYWDKDFAVSVNSFYYFYNLESVELGGVGVIGKNGSNTYGISTNRHMFGQASLTYNSFTIKNAVISGENTMSSPSYSSGNQTLYNKTLAVNTTFHSYGAIFYYEDSESGTAADNRYTNLTDRGTKTFELLHIADITEYTLNAYTSTAIVTDWRINEEYNVYRILFALTANHVSGNTYEALDNYDRHNNQPPTDSSSNIVISLYADFRFSSVWIQYANGYSKGFGNLTGPNADTPSQLQYRLQEALDWYMYLHNDNGEFVDSQGHVLKKNLTDGLWYIKGTTTLASRVRNTAEQTATIYIFEVPSVSSASAVAGATQAAQTLAPSGNIHGFLLTTPLVLESGQSLAITTKYVKPQWIGGSTGRGNWSDKIPYGGSEGDPTSTYGGTPVQEVIYTQLRETNDVGTTMNYSTINGLFEVKRGASLKFDRINIDVSNYTTNRAIFYVGANSGADAGTASLKINEGIKNQTTDANRTTINGGGCGSVVFYADTAGNPTIEAYKLNIVEVAPIDQSSTTAAIVPYIFNINGGTNHVFKDITVQNFEHPLIGPAIKMSSTGASTFENVLIVGS